MKTKWSKEEVAILRENYKKMPAAELAKMLNRRRAGVIGKAFREGLASPFVPAMPKPDKQGFRQILVSPRAMSQVRQLVAMLNERRITSVVFCTHVGIPLFTFYRWRTGGISPRMFDLEACFNYFGYTLPDAVPIKEKDHEG